MENIRRIVQHILPVFEFYPIRHECHFLRICKCDHLYIQPVLLPECFLLLPELPDQGAADIPQSDDEQMDLLRI